MNIYIVTTTDRNDPTSFAVDSAHIDPTRAEQRREELELDHKRPVWANVDCVGLDDVVLSEVT